MEKKHHIYVAKGFPFSSSRKREREREINSTLSHRIFEWGECLYMVAQMTLSREVGTIICCCCCCLIKWIIHQKKKMNCGQYIWPNQVSNRPQIIWRIYEEYVPASAYLWPILFFFKENWRKSIEHYNQSS